MARSASSHPTDVELEILQVLWDAGPGSLGDVCVALQKNRSVAKTTVATMLGVMLDKKLVKRSKGPRGYRWQANVSRDDAASGILGKLLDRVFDGSARRLVAHLLEAGELSDLDCKELRRLLASEGSEQRSAKKKKEPSTTKARKGKQL